MKENCDMRPFALRVLWSHMTCLCKSHFYLSNVKSEEAEWINVCVFVEHTHPESMINKLQHNERLFTFYLFVMGYYFIAYVFHSLLFLFIVHIFASLSADVYIVLWHSTIRSNDSFLINAVNCIYVNKTDCFYLFMELCDK